MSIEAPVQPPVPALVHQWTFNRRLGAHVYPITVINATPAINVKRDHRYKVTASAAGYMNCAGPNVRWFSLEAGSDQLVSQRVGMDRGGWNALFAFPIHLCGLWTATADAAVMFKFQMTRAVAADVDDELAVAFHNMQVEDLGHV